MFFINPIELLQLKTDQEILDLGIVKRAKRRLYADIELSDDGLVDFNGRLLSRNDCEAAIAWLDDPIVNGYCQYLLRNVELSSLLSTGNVTKVRDITKDDVNTSDGFIDFIRPFLVAQYNRVVHQAFKSCNTDNLSSLLDLQWLIVNADYATAFKYVTTEINDLINEIDALANEISNEPDRHPHESVDALCQLLCKKIHIGSYNLLPSFFQSQRNKIALRMNNLQVIIWEKYQVERVPLMVLDHILRLAIDGPGVSVYQGNYEVMKTKYRERLWSEKNKPLVNEWADIIRKLEALVKDIVAKTITPHDALPVVQACVSIDKINHLPVFGNEIRNEVARCLRALSNAAWNEQHDLIVAKLLIEMALTVTSSGNDRELYEQDLQTVNELFIKYEGVLVCYFCESYPPNAELAFKVEIFKVMNRSTYAVEYQRSTFNVPRCQSCKLAHDEWTRVTFSGLSGGIVLGALMSSIAYDTVFSGGIIGGVIGFMFGKYLYNLRIQKLAIKTDTVSIALQHPMLKSLISEGWSVNNPTQ